MNDSCTKNYLKTTAISALSILASVAAILAILAIVDVISWNDVGEALWRTTAVMAVVAALAVFTGLLIDWAKTNR